MNERSSTMRYSWVNLKGEINMRYPTFVPKLAPSIYNGGIKLYKHEFDLGTKYIEDSNLYQWVETILGVKFEVGKIHRIGSIAWTVAYIGDLNDSYIEIALVRTQGGKMFDYQITIPRNKMAAVHYDRS